MAHNHTTPRIDNSHTTFVNCLRNWDDPFLHGHSPVKSIHCIRCDGCGCKLNSSGNYESANNQPNNENSSSYSSSSETSHCLNAHSNSSDLSNRHYLCNTHSSNLNRHLSVNSLNQRAARAVSSLHTSKLQV